jgi:hypothetical protein
MAAALDSDAHQEFPPLALDTPESGDSLFYAPPEKESAEIIRRAKERGNQ